MEEIRINKYLSDAGVCSRREADRLLEAGRITVDGVTAVTGQKVTGKEKICVDKKPVEPETEEILLAFHKPKGIVCTTSKKDKDNIVDYINYEKRIYPVGRLDKDSEGLILLTNQGELSDKLLRGSNGHEKEYLVTVNKRLTKDFIEGMSGGVPILDRVTKPCKITPLDDYTFKIILTQGWNRQIRRMCEYFDYRVRRLIRIRVMNIQLGNLQVGTYRKITGKEKAELMARLNAKADERVKADDRMKAAGRAKTGQGQKKTEKRGKSWQQKTPRK